MKNPTVGKLERASPAQAEAEVKRAVVDLFFMARMGHEVEVRACLPGLPIGKLNLKSSSSVPLFLAPLHP